uniref:Ribosomal RNA-processing protein 8 n=1 Tax=Percolomonas cosmopolitus TaxID=63605 RepID=A0A7S1KRD1_9EUKA
MAKFNKPIATFKQKELKIKESAPKKGKKEKKKEKKLLKQQRRDLPKGAARNGQNDREGERPLQKNGPNAKNSRGTRGKAEQTTQRPKKNKEKYNQKKKAAAAVDPTPSKHSASNPVAASAVVPTVQQEPSVPAETKSQTQQSDQNKPKSKKKKNRKQKAKNDTQNANSATNNASSQSKKSKRRDSSKVQEPSRKKRKLNDSDTDAPTSQLDIAPADYNPLSSLVLNPGAASTKKAKTELLASVQQEPEVDPATATLVSSQFRLLNEKYYVQNSNAMMQYLRENPSAFEVYHKGFEQSRKKWNFDPFSWIVPSLLKHFEERCVKQLTRYRSKELRTFHVVDMGCGKAELELLFRKAVDEKFGEALKRGDLNYEIYFENLDMVAANERVKVADMRNTNLRTASCDAVVYSLSLMGTNYLDFLVEGYRLLKKGGIMPIVEIESRVVDASEFMIFMHDHLFMNKLRNDLKKGYFQYYLFQKKNFRDQPKEVSGLRVHRELLLPSLYKKR